MVKAPQVSGLILCERERVETAPARFILDGLILAREFSIFPTQEQAVTIYAAFFGGRGEAELKLTCMHLESEEDVYYHKRWYAFPPGVPIVHCTIPVKRLMFPIAGRYLFTLFFDDVVLTTRILDVRQA